jgi:hypothetical protein
VAERKSLTEGLSRAEMLNDPFTRRSLQDYIFQVGQPTEVRNAFLAAMGINATDIDTDEVQADLISVDPLAPGVRSG